MTTIFANNCSDGVVFGVVGNDTSGGVHVIQSINHKNLHFIIAGSNSVISSVNDMVNQFAVDKDSGKFAQSSTRNAARSIDDTLMCILMDIHEYFVKKCPWFIPELYSAPIIAYDCGKLGLCIGRRLFKVTHDFVSVGSETDLILPHLFYTKRGKPLATVYEFEFELNKNVTDYQIDYNRAIPDIAFQKILDV